jgi:hypothetical protein
MEPEPRDVLERVQHELPSSVLSWRVSGEDRRWDRQTIFDYIDGHAEVYLAYGMRGCLSRRYVDPEGVGDIVVDVFWMAGPDDAWGVFTFDREGEPQDVGTESLWRYGWLSFVKGDIFGSIYAESEDDASRRAVLELGRHVAKAVPAAGGPPELVGELPHRGLNPASVRFLRSHQILDTHLGVGTENLLQLGPGSAVAVGTYIRDGARAHLVLSEVDDEDTARRLALAVAEGWLGGVPGQPAVTPAGDTALVAPAGRKVVLVLDAQTPELAAELLAEFGGTP